MKRDRSPRGFLKVDLLTQIGNITNHEVLYTCPRRTPTCTRFARRIVPAQVCPRPKGAVPVSQFNFLPDNSLRKPCRALAFGPNIAILI
jgi:hypothetical protein